MDIGTLANMATTLNVDPEFQAAVERAREQPRERGELRDGPWAPPSDPLPESARDAPRDWVSSGDYDRVVAEVVAGDPDMQTQ